MASMRVAGTALRADRRAVFGPTTVCALLALAGCSDLARPDPVVLEIVGGDAQEARVLDYVHHPLEVVVTDPDSVPVSGAVVEWSAADGAVDPATSITDGSGRASAVWRLGSTLGEQSAIAMTAGGVGVVFEARAVRGDSTYTLRLDYHRSGFPDSLRLAIRDADAWEALYANHFDAPPFRVNFDRYMVLVAAMGRRPMGGYSIGIDSVRAHGAELDVFITRDEEPSGYVQQWETAPVHVVSIPATEAQVVWHERVMDRE